MPGPTRGRTEVPTQWDAGQMLYNRQRNPLDPFWTELPPQMREAWAACERYLRFTVRRLEEPHAPLTEPETAIERHERHISAIQAVLLRPGGGDLREVAEDLLAAADTGI